MNEIQAYSLQNEGMHRDKRELFYLLQNFSQKSIVVSTVEVLKIFLDNYKQGIIEGGESPHDIMKPLQEVDKRNLKRGCRAGRQKKALSTDRQMLSKSQKKSNRRMLSTQHYKAKMDLETWMKRH